VERPHRCAIAGCGKRYKNPNGLKYHMAHAHPNFVRHLGTTMSGSASSSTSSIGSSSNPRYIPSSSSSSSNHLAPPYNTTLNTKTAAFFGK
jgi:hypothetical protein